MKKKKKKTLQKTKKNNKKKKKRKKKLHLANVNAQAPANVVLQVVPQLQKSFLKLIFDVWLVLAGLAGEKGEREEEKKERKKKKKKRKEKNYLSGVGELLLAVVPFAHVVLFLQRTRRKEMRKPFKTKEMK